MPPLRAAALRKTARAIPAMTNLTIPDGFTAARAALAEAGVALTFVREVPGTRVCGATWWLAADRPVIGLTARGRKPDTFWFNLLHEVAHILLHPTAHHIPRPGHRENRQRTRGTSSGPDFAEQTLLPDDARARSPGRPPGKSYCFSPPGSA